MALLESTQFRVKQVAIESKGGSAEVSAIYDEINIYDSLFMPMMSGNILLTDAIGLSNALKFDGTESITIEIEKSENFLSFKKSFRIYKQTDRKNVNPSTEKYVLHFVADEFITSLQKRVNRSYESTYSGIVQNILKDYIQLESKKRGMFESTTGIRKVVIPNLPPIEAIEWCAKRSLDARDAPCFLFFSNIFGYNFVSLSSLVNKDTILKINFDAKNLTEGDAMSELSSARSFQLVLESDSTDKIKSGVTAGKFIGFDPLTRSFKEKEVTFDDHYGLVNHLNSTPNKLEFSSVDSRKVLSIFGTDRRKSRYIKKYEPHSIPKIEIYEDLIFQRKAIFKNLVAKKIKIVMPGNFQLTSGFNVEILTSGFNKKNKGSENDEVSLNGKYLIVATRHTITNNRHETLIEVVTDSMNATSGSKSNFQVDERLRGD